jgi:RNAse (barnase) inhibitor barstar
MSCRPQDVEIDLTDVATDEQLHVVLMRKLNFPDFYGRNWDAFWDTITGLVEMPRSITFHGWSQFEKRFPGSAHHLRECLARANQQLGCVDCTVTYV